MLLRGINLGRAKRVGMADLRGLLTDHGYGDVATLVQSGNVVLDPDQPAGQLAGAKYLVAFMSGSPEPGLAAAFDGVDPGDDRYVPDGTELYLWCPGGQLDSPLMTAPGRVRGGPVTTVRNWNTVGKLAALLER